MSRLITGSGSSAYVGGKLVDIGTSVVYPLHLNRNIIGKLLRPPAVSARMHRHYKFYVCSTLQFQTSMQLIQV